MALLQVYQAKALKDLHEGGHNLAVLHELHASTDLALRATKVTAQSLGCAMSTLVVREHNLWLCLTDMEQKKVQFPNATVLQTGLFGNAVKSFAQQFSPAQRQTEVIRQPLSLLVAVGAPLQLPPLPRCRSSLPKEPGSVVETPSLSRPPPNECGGKCRCKRPWDGRPRDRGDCSSEMVSHLSLPRRSRVENIVVLFCYPKT